MALDGLSFRNWSKKSNTIFWYPSRASPISRSPTTVCSVARVYEQCATGAMTIHWLSFPFPCAVFRTWLYIATFGPTETSYHDMNQSPGMLMGMLSCQ